MFAKHRSAFLH